MKKLILVVVMLLFVTALKAQTITSEINNFNIQNKELSFDLYISSTGAFEMGSSIFTWTYPKNAALSVELQDINPRYTIGSPGYYQMQSGLFYGNKVSIQIVHLYGNGQLIRDTPELVATVKIQLADNNFSLVWDELNSNIANPQYGHPGVSQWLGGYLPKTKIKAYPNPFNPETNIEFQIDVTSYVRLDVYDAQGKLIKTLTEGYKTPGTYIEKFSAESSGTYYYRYVMGNKVIFNKLILIK